MRHKLAISIIALACFFTAPAQQTQSIEVTAITGFRDAAAELEREKRFMAVPDSARAEAHLKTITAQPHMAGTAGDRRVVDYMAAQFRAAGLETEIKEYRVWMPYPGAISVRVTAPAGMKLVAPHREQMASDPFLSNPEITIPFNAYSPSGDAEGEIVYANYARPEDFEKLAELKVDVKGKIILARYGGNYRGVKADLAAQHGAVGLIMYSDPADDGWTKGDKYPLGPYRPDTAVQRGSILSNFFYTGDPTTPGVASTVGLADSQRVAPEKALTLPRIPTTPLSYNDAWPILEKLAGPASPREWQGALPFTYHVGAGPVRVKMSVRQQYAYRSIWNVTGTIRGRELPDEWVVAGNHHDAWVYGAVDPNSGTAAMMETARGLGEMLKSGWRPRRTIVLAEWDAEEFGLIGSTEWGEEMAEPLRNAVAYFNMDTAVSGPNFGGAAVPSLRAFVREVTRGVASPAGGSVYDRWKAGPARRGAGANQEKPPAEPTLGDLGSGSDFTVFLQHLGIPSTDIGSGGPYGVYHSAFDNFAWFKKFGDPEFKYEAAMARVMGVQLMRMAEADVLPFDYEEYGREVIKQIEETEKRAKTKFGETAPSFAEALAAGRAFSDAGAEANKRRASMPADAAALNRALRDVERALLLPDGLPQRPWFKHSIWAPGRYTGYAAVPLPGITEPMDAGERATVELQVKALTAALTRATEILRAGVSK